VTDGDALTAMTRDYRIALMRFLPRQGEAARAAGYEWGRSAVAASVSLLDVVEIHHLVLREVLADTASEEVGDVIETASAFLTEVVAPYDMTRSGLLEANQHRRDGAERR
jgi:hypothetical protein